MKQELASRFLRAVVELCTCGPHLPGRISDFFPRVEKIFRRIDILLYYLFYVYVRSLE